MSAGQALTLKQASEKAGCHIETLRRAIRRRQLLATRHATKSGHPYIVNSVDLGHFLEKRRVS